MYRHGIDGPQFRPVPAAPPPPRVMGGPFISPPPSLPPPPQLPPHVRLPAVQQHPILQQYAYPPPPVPPPPMPQNAAPVLLPPPGSLRLPGPPPMHPPMPSLQTSALPPMQRPLPPPNMPPPSLPQPRPLLQQPPPPMQAGFQSIQSSVPPVRQIVVPFQAPLMQMQVQPPMSFVPMPLPSVQPVPFLPPLPPSPPMENPPPPPPASPPPQSPPPPHVEELLTRLEPLLSPEPPKPADPEMLKNIDVLAAFVVKNGPRFESMARARQAGDPKFAFLFESDAAPEAAVGHEFYKWKKKSIALELGLESGTAQTNKADGRAFAGVKTTTALSDDIPVSPTMSDMDMEDDFSPSPSKEPVQQLECGNPRNSGSELKDIPSMNGDLAQRDGAQEEPISMGALPLNTKSNERVLQSSLQNAEEQRTGDGRIVSNSHHEMDPILQKISNSIAKNVLGSHSSSKASGLVEEQKLSHQEHRAPRLSRWEALPRGGSNRANHKAEIFFPQNVDKLPSPTHADLMLPDPIGINGNDNVQVGKVDSGLFSQEVSTVDEFGRLVRKEAAESEGEDDVRPRKRRRSFSRGRSGSRSRSPSRGRSRSGSRSRNRERSRSRSYSPDEPRWKRQGFSRSPSRRGRWSRSHSRSPSWHRNDSRSPSRDKWGGVARIERDWRNDRESYGRGRRGGRGSGPPVCFHYARGRCFRGIACKFLHPEREIVPERRVQQGNDQIVGSKNLESLVSGPSIALDSVGPAIQGSKSGPVSPGVSIEVELCGTQELGSIVDKEKKIEMEQPILEGESMDIAANVASEKPKEDNTMPDESLERVQEDESNVAESNPAQTDSVKNIENIQESVEVGSIKIDMDGNSKVVDELEDKAAEQIDDAKKGMSPKQQQFQSVSNMKVEENNAELSLDTKALEVKLAKPDLSVELEEIKSQSPAAIALDDSGVDQKGSLSSVLPSQAKVPTNTLEIPRSSSNENFVTEQSVLVSKALDSGNFSPPTASRVPSATINNRNSLSLSSPMRGQQPLISHPMVHGALQSQSSYVSAFQPHRGARDIARQQEPALLPQDRPPRFEMHHPEQLPPNRSMPQQFDNQSLPKREPWDLGATFPSMKQESPYARLMDNNTNQYGHSLKLGEVVQHAFPISNIMTSSAHKSLPWNQNTSLASTLPALSSRAEQYSYTLTTIPPLPSLIKLPKGSNIPSSNEQYDPLSDGLEQGPAPVASVANADTSTMNEAAADVGVVENVSPPGEWSPVQPGDTANTALDHSKSKKSNRGLKLLRTAVADRVKVLLKPAWKEGRLSKDAFKTIAKKAVEKVTGNLPSHHIPKSQEKVDQFMSVSSSKITKLVQGYIDKYSKA